MFVNNSNKVDKSWFAIVIFFVTALTSAWAVNASPINGLAKQGQGQMNVLFWSVYQAEYFTNHAKQMQMIDTDTDTDTDTVNYRETKALRLTYLRDIKKSELIEATNDQWQHLDLSLPNKQLWLNQLKQIWPDIRENDTLTLLVDEDNASHFYLSNHVFEYEKQGEIVDPDFAQAFLAIWLSEKTSRPELRQQLLGLNP